MTVPEKEQYEIASNVLNMEADQLADKEEAVDVLKEILNITCGQILSLLGDKHVYELTIPEISCFDKDNYHRLLSH